MDRRTFLGVSGGAVWAAMAEARLRAQAGATAGPIVEVQSGRLRGVSNGGVQIFKGIPYGAPPTGARRFLPAVAPDPWTGVRDASEYGQRFYQPFRPMIPTTSPGITSKLTSFSAQNCSVF